MKSKVVISQCSSYEVSEITKSIDTLFSAFDANKIFLPDQRVLIKPNLIAADHPDEASVTHPAVIESLVLKLKSLGLRPVIGDSPAFGPIKGIAKATGLEHIAHKHSVPLVRFKGNVNAYRFGCESVFLHSLEYRKQRLI